MMPHGGAFVPEFTQSIRDKLLIYSKIYYFHMSTGTEVEKVRQGTMTPRKFLGGEGLTSTTRS
jgi:hypothetical protein